MHITKRQSLFIAGGAMALFFGVGIIFIKTDAKKVKFNNSAAAPTSAPDVENRIDVVATAVSNSSNSSSQPEDTLFTMNEFHRSEIKDGRKLWEVRGRQAQYYPETNSVRISNAELSLLSKTGQETQLSTKVATVSMSGATLSKAHLEQGVTAVFDHKYTLTAESAECDRISNTVSIPSHVTIVGEALKLSGDSLHGAIDSQTFTITGNVLTELQPSKKRLSQ